MNKRWRNVGLYVLAVITVIFIGTSVFDKPNTESSTKTLRYSDFIEAVQDKEISRVLISPDNATAQVVENDGSRSEVNLAPDKDLLKIQNKIINDFEQVLEGPNTDEFNLKEDRLPDGTHFSLLGYEKFAKEWMIYLKN